MLPETMLEYLVLREFMNNNVIASWENKNSKENRAWYSDDTDIKLDINKVKSRLTELEKQIIKPYVIDNPA